MRLTALALLVGLTGTARAAEPDTYIFDLLVLQPYKGNFARLVKGEGVPDWVKAIVVQGAGTAGPAKTVDVAGTPYRLDRVCKADACAGNTIDVLWGPGGRRVWAALVEDGRSPLMLGDPKGPQAKALETAAKPSTAAATPAGPVASASSAVAQPAPASPTAPAAPSAPAAETDAYIFDVLPLQPYKGNFARLVKGKGVPGWVKAISAQGAGAAGPAKTVEVAGAPYRLDRVCRVGASCAADRVDVLWGPRGARVWAALVEDGKPPVMLGEPKGAQAEALAGAAGAPSSPAASAQPTPAASSPAAPK